MSSQEKLKDAKKFLRRSLLLRRRRMTEEARAAASRVIVERLLAEKAWATAGTVFVFYSMPEEVQLQGLYEAADAAGKHLLFPLCFPQGRMEAYEVRDRKKMKPDRHGIPAPDSGKDLFVPSDAIDLVVAPLLGFDRECFRIGYGGGYYDRFLARLKPSCAVIGVCYARQEEKHIPREAFDLSLPLLLTELERLEA